MTINANELALLLRGGMAAKQADLLAAWIVQTQTVLDAVGAADLADILSDISTLQGEMSTAQGDISDLETATGADHTTLTRLLNGVVQLAAKLDDDDGVTDEDYAAVLDAILNPA